MFPESVEQRFRVHDPPKLDDLPTFDSTLINSKGSCLLVAEVGYRGFRASPRLAFSISTDSGRTEGRVRNDVFIEELREPLQVASITRCEQLLEK